MGSPKQLLKWKDKTMLGHIVDVALESEAGEVMVIVGAEAEKVKQVIPPARAPCSMRGIRLDKVNRSKRRWRRQLILRRLSSY